IAIAEVFGRRSAAAPITTAPGVAAATQIMALDLAGIMVSAGAACSSGKVGPSHVLAAMGLPPVIADSAIRVSLGWTTTEGDIEQFVAAWTMLHRRLQQRRAA
ncbi:MAG: aminotransferase class V-fold PLP-dependent enzyme, partial [Stellaceae bacterium]